MTSDRPDWATKILAALGAAVVYGDGGNLTRAESALLDGIAWRLRARLGETGPDGMDLDGLGRSAIRRAAGDIAEEERLSVPTEPAETDRELTYRQDRILTAAYRDVEAVGRRAPTPGTFGFEEWTAGVLVAAGETHTVRRGLRVSLGEIASDNR